MRLAFPIVRCLVPLERAYARIRRSLSHSLSAAFFYVFSWRPFTIDIAHLIGSVLEGGLGCEGKNEPYADEDQVRSHVIVALLSHIVSK